MSAPYRLVVPPVAPARPLALDEEQERVAAHRGGPLLVLAGPGTGKTATLVEAVARRIEGGTDPARLLVLTFSRRAALELRERITARVDRPSTAPLAWTFHAWCYALVREQQDQELWQQPLRLLSGPEQDVVLRDLLDGIALDGLPWPAALRGALRTRGLADEVRALLARARERGLDPHDLDVPELGRLWEEYLAVLDARGVLDYAELVHRAGLLLADPEVARTLRGRYDAVYVDECQDTDPAQLALLRVLGEGGRDLVAVGDPDQSIYRFRGADVGGLARLRHELGGREGPVPVVALRHCRRSGPGLRAVAALAIDRVPLTGIPADVAAQHRSLRADGPPGDPVEVLIWPTQVAEGEGIADLLRREHLERGTPWSSMAVLVRSAVRSVPPLRRALGEAGIPVEVAGDDVPLAREPGLAPLLLALRVAASPGLLLTEETARTLLLSPLGAADPTGLRRLGRWLRDAAAERAAPAPASDPAAVVPVPALVPPVVPVVPGPTARLLRDALADPTLLAGAPEAAAQPVRRLAERLAGASAAIADGLGAQEALWRVWAKSPWARRLERDSAGGGPRAREADRELDAVVALFAAVGRAAEQRVGLGVDSLLDELEAQQIPADALDERGVRGAGVRLLTAHRSKGLEWDVVVVADVQADGWPDLRTRATLLRVPGQEEAGRRELLADERRLFYVALTRARRRLVVTAVDSGEEGGDVPSALLDDLDLEAEHRDGGSARRPLTPAALVGELRRLATDGPTEPLRRAAAARLARIAGAQAPDGSALVPAADPDRWWGTRAVTVLDRPLRDPALPVALSASTVDGLARCPLQWFLRREVGAAEAADPAMGFGGVLHALAHEVVTGVTPAELAALEARLETVWAGLRFDAPWEQAAERAAATAALARFLAWHAADRGREVVGSEQSFAVELTVQDEHGPITVALRGYADRLEVDADGQVHVVDFKTGRRPGTAKGAEDNVQLGIYQLGVRGGALGPPGSEPGGAELVHLRVDGKPAGQPKRQGMAALPPAGQAPVERVLAKAARDLLEERLPPRPEARTCERCALRVTCPARDEGQQVVA